MSAPDLVLAVPQLPPDVLHRVIQVCGLEDCGDLVALATPGQLGRVLDLDVWRAGRPGLDEELDADRFGMWIEMLMKSGAASAAEKLTAIDIDLVIAGLAGHAAVFDIAAVSPFTTLDGNHVSPARAENREHTREIGGYLIEARRTIVWETIADLLLFLDAEHPDYFHRLMRGCRRLSNGEREVDGLHDLLSDDEQEMFDLACDRETRREKQGYVTPAQARAFLQTARQIRLADECPPSYGPIARAYFRAIESTPSHENSPPACGSVLQASTSEPARARKAHAIAAVVEVLRDAGIMTPRRAMIETGQGGASRLALMHSYMASSTVATEQLAYLSNAIMAGCSIQARPFAAEEASDAVVAICNLGLENWPHQWHDRDLVIAFQVGWTILHRDVCMYAAEQLIRILTDMHCRDRDIQLRLRELRLELTACCRDGTPWRARHALEALLMLDAPSWAGMVGLIDECPVLHGVIGASRRPGTRTVSASAFEFISENNQIAAVREFMRSLPDALTR